MTQTPFIFYFYFNFRVVNNRAKSVPYWLKLTPKKDLYIKQIVGKSYGMRIKTSKIDCFAAVTELT